MHQGCRGCHAEAAPAFYPALRMAAAECGPMLLVRLDTRKRKKCLCVLLRVSQGSAYHIGGGVPAKGHNKPDDTSGAHPRGVLARAAILNRINVHLDGVLVCQQVDDLESMLNDPGENRNDSGMPTS